MTWPTAALALAVTAILVSGIGCGADNDEDSAGSTEAATASPAGDDPAGTIKVWFTAGEQFQTVERELDPKDSQGSHDSQGSPVEPALDALLAGPTERELASGADTDTQIPAGTELEDVAVEPDGTATVRLSGEFAAGIPADPAKRTADERQKLNARLGQVTYTMTQFSDIAATKVVSGEVALQAGRTREDYAAPPEGPKQLRKSKGAKLPGIRQVQTKLAKLGYLPKDAVDGLNGYRTQQAVIAFQSWEGLGRDGVVGPQTSAELTRARRPAPGPGGPSKRIEVYIGKGVTLLVKNGRTRRAIHSSAGAPGTDTPTGRFQVFRKELRSWSVPFSTWLPYAAYFNNGIAFHEYPDVPTYPASHGCVRLPAPEAPGVYEFAAVGTTVVVYG